MEAEDLLVKIESYRSKMVQLGLTSSFLDERVVNLSYELDKLLNKYQAVVCSTGKK
ncbi:aspartyl-phosphate phosphatase Spo0E family protein [Bacillus sp. IITD106]|nr:aspartyl-phosphate phosphatase Spo0E family protein [Bacillus sp. IITD106]